MTASTKIEWADSTFNPWQGCTKISAACDHCYAEARMDVRLKRVEWGAGKARVRTSPGYWRHPLQWNAQPFYECTGCGLRGDARDFLKNGHPLEVPPHAGEVKPARRRVFCASLADVFDNDVDPQWRRDLFDLIARTPNLDWLLLTKRVGNVARMVAEIADMPRTASHAGDLMAHQWRKGNPPAHVLLGATICDQPEADRDVPKLLATPAAKRFLSIEPMLGPLDLSEWLWNFKACANCPCPDPRIDRAGYEDCCREPELRDSDLHWVICGGESGPHARPMHPDWARSLRDQCAAAGVPFLFKQWGEWLPAGQRASASMPTMTREKQIEHECAGRFQFARSRPDAHISTDVPVWRVGKHAAGRLLDGVEHNGVPT